MTYMSIPEGLLLLVQSRRLFCVPSLITGFDTGRTLYVSVDVMNAIQGPFADDGADDELIEFRQQLDAFLELGVFTVATDPRNKSSDAMLARVDPVGAELWDIRSVVPHPGVRCLGGFWEKDAFVALTWNFRVNIVGDDGWGADIERCRTAWRDLFGAVPPFAGRRLDDYLSNFEPV